MIKNNFETVRQAENLASKIIRKKTFQWLQAAAEDGLTHFKNIKDLEISSDATSSFMPQKEGILIPRLVLCHKKEAI